MKIKEFIRVLEYVNIFEDQLIEKKLEVVNHSGFKINLKYNENEIIAINIEVKND